MPTDPPPTKQPPTAEMPALEAPCAGWLRDRYEVGALWATRGPVRRYLGLDHAAPAGPLPVWILLQDPPAAEPADPEAVDLGGDRPPDDGDAPTALLPGGDW